MNNVIKSVIFAAVVMVAGIVTMQTIYNTVTSQKAANIEPAAGSNTEGTADEAQRVENDIEKAYDEMQEDAQAAADAMIESLKGATESAEEFAEGVAEDLQQIAPAAGEQVQEQALEEAEKAAE